jgi:integrase/recombinase XerD
MTRTDALAPGVLSADAEEFLSWLAVERGRARHTLAAYRRDLVAYQATVAAAGLDLAHAGPAQVEGHLHALAEQGRAPASVARAHSAIRGLHRFMVDEGRAAGDPTADLAPARVPLRLPKALSEAQVQRILEAPTEATALGRRDRALLEVLYGTGARISEAVGLDLADLASGEGLVRLYGKGDKERLVPLGRYAARALADWLSAPGRERLAPRQWRRRSDAEAVFLNARGGRLTRQGAYAVVRAAAARAGLEASVGPHVLRHSCATHMLGHGADIRAVQELLGHASIGTTQLYTRVTPEHLRRAYEAAHPRAR